MDNALATHSPHTLRTRLLVLFPMIAVVTLLWTLLLKFTNLPALALAVVALTSLLLLSVTTAWTAIAVPRRDAA
jgi:hypothetical protein